jgi:putative phosphoesterase
MSSERQKKREPTKREEFRMLFAAIADIHGNCSALEAVLADVRGQGIETVVSLGDHLSGPLEASRTAELLLNLAIPSIRGNHDRLLVEGCVNQMGLSDRAAFEQLDGRHKEWLASLPATLQFRDEVFLCHGTPKSDTRYWLEAVNMDGVVHMSSIEDIEREAADVEFSLILCGHTHIPRIVRLRDGRLIVNPGSVGCPAFASDLPVSHVVEAGTPDACYAILEKRNGRWAASFRYVPYNHMAMAEMAKARTRPEWASALATGWLR